MQIFKKKYLFIKNTYNKIKIGGYAITCGWNSYGWGKRFGFEPVELLIVCHSSAHNDTMVLVERKVQEVLIQ